MVYDLAFLKPIENANEGSDCEVLLPLLFIKYHLLLLSSEAEERDRWHKRPDKGSQRSHPLSRIKDFGFTWPGEAQESCKDMRLRSRLHSQRSW